MEQTTNTTQREKIGSRLGFILLSAGCAIGIGNVWKFPYMVGQYGGGIFVLIYLLFLVIMGVPVLTIEFALGRASRKSPALLYQQLEKPGQKWHIHGYAAVVGNVLLMMFYTVVAGWMLYYFKAEAFGDLQDLDTTQVGAFFADEVLGNPWAMLLCTALVIVASFGVCAIGVKNGLEKVTKVMMIALLVLMVAIAVYCCCLDGAGAGLQFYLVPNFARMKEAGIGNVIVAAMNQAFFTLSLGIGAMAIFGSYIGKERALLGEAVNVAALDTFVAFTSGLIIFPACFAFNTQVDAGPNLIFVTLPNVFNNMPLGRLWGSLFFVFMTFAAFSTVLGVFELIIASTCDLFGWSRKKACLIDCLVMLVLALPCIFGFNYLANFAPAGKNIMDWEDFLVSNILLPLGSLTFVFFCITKKGWGWDNFKDEANAGKGLKVKKWMRGYITFVLPVIIAILFVVGILQTFGVF